MKLAAALILFMGISTAGIAQTNSGKDNTAIVIAAKPLSAADSGMVKQLFFSALREKTIDNSKLAFELFNRILQIDPTNDATMFELANMEKARNNIKAAQPLLERAVTVNPNNEWYWIALAGSYEKNNDIVKLENVFNELIRINPTKPDYYYDEANALFIQKRYDEALKMYDKVEELAGPSEELLVNRQKIYIRQGDVKKATSALDELIAANPTQVKYYLMQAEIYNSNNLNDKAIAALQKAKTIDPKNGAVHLAFADIYREQNNPEASFDELELAFAIPDVDIEQKIRILLGYVPKFPEPNAKASALELSRILVVAHPADSKAYAMYGDMLLQSEKVPEAKAAYKKAISLNNQAYNVQEQLVRIDLSENDLDAAIKDGESSLSFFPNQAWMNYMVGIAWQQKRGYAKAISYLKNAVSLETQDKELLTQAYSALGDCYHSLGENTNSDSAYEKAIAISPDNAFTLNNYAYYLSLRNERLESAAQMSKHCNDLQPNTASFEDTYAWILFKQKNYTEAKLWIEKSLLHDKGNSAVKTEHYGDILFFLGDVDAALQNWAKAKAQGGKSPVLERKINEKKYFE
ncbi:tetratricopeptide repeat protein [Mucilaginibacter terrigena]|uniref:Tetratricopeptide repeat protein n=1 Tax=Mucilaginibacter terrigena TaxID=2492395 RepID=A0A4Q5LGS2_9SPHI|nr:tetratricopeptide repeat protein [Mucilaginibacter terrigena]RYU86174.1 tetratricopeptide repeat protein [Mucilaginibacter terrigena]